MSKVKYRVREYNPTSAQQGSHSFFAEAVINNEFARKDGVEWFERTTNRIIERMDEWRKDNAFVLACASVANERQKEKTK